ncbi:MAG: hypothetical protein RMM06_05925 [Armatimonadota bacterium]|nr:hypothetical protein [bacterium]MCS7310549.1 hypothetical protein [Armatimonadota bacterium]MDW8290241.1 hypothetical protein [Armatimonadota bacterium]
MEGTGRRNIAVIILVGIVLIGIAMLLRFQIQREEPPPPGYYTGPMLPKSQRMGPPGGGGGTPQAESGQTTQ